MAASTHAALREKRAAFFAGSTRYQRGDRTLSLQKSRRRRVLRPRHVLGLLLLAAGFFAAFEQAYLFLISSDELAIRTVRVRCGDESLFAAIAGRFAGRRLGNILLFDINTLRRELQTDPWIRDVSVRKVFPSSIDVDVFERKAFVLLEDGGLSLVDEDGAVLEKPASPERWDLPVVRGRGLVEPGFPERWEAVKAVLAALPPEESARLSALECSPYGDMALSFEGDPLRIIVDSDSAAEKLALVRSLRADWESRFGALDSADLRFSDRVILSPSGSGDGAPAVSPDKETD
jgi:cell division septal protein FtsQ